MQAFLIAVQFLTTLPVALRHPPTDSEIGRSLAFYPLVGLVLGIILATSGWLLRLQNPVLVSALLLTIWTAVTGALHLDGLADCADAWVGGRGDRERTLAIMKDPYSGPMGVVAIVIILFLKFAALTVLCENKVFIALVLVPVLGKAAVQVLFLTTPYVRAVGLGAPIASYMRRGEILVALLLVSLGAFLTAGSGCLLVLTATTGVLLLFRRSMLARIGGVTGDAVGALVEIAEACALLAFCFVGR
ncbi:MAG: adenosylcobinamide-GDP ribazoletransferase [Alphaproteobacteria bacterium]|nr:adenosylcobinamide-GDP ribazoletransferase [Alphaproteobacteria bacterium]MDE2112704.1 adenosylcobinamide-GDP ribazoletransferase [Alphaproteobacteria bacterium]MDE2494735.1 adenosylcobinamide-GDP ribazoletransferase [Alphaproteobacteria bacterium]